MFIVPAEAGATSSGVCVCVCVSRITHTHTYARTDAFPAIDAHSKRPAKHAARAVDVSQHDSDDRRGGNLDKSQTSATVVTLVIVVAITMCVCVCVYVRACVGL